jgi:2-polyprenyl-3-methyl-5-hydroxy-6-metoxy-1,4-benzoquinol methylase
MMKDFGGPLNGGMPLYKYLGNRALSAIENKVLGLNLTEFHSGYRAYNVHALKQIELDKMTDDFHFDTEIIIKLRHQNFRIKEVPIPTFYGDEVCHVNGMRYAKDVLRALYRYTATVRSVRAYPEYQEYFVPYPVKQSLYSSHYYASRLAGTGHRILDVNRGDGTFGAQLKRAGNTVTGLGAGPDLEHGLGAVSASGETFERVLVLDTIEHLRDPSRLLEDCRRLLAERGRLIVSVPNVANITVRFALSFGRFPYSDRGILDWSHLRFFTKRSLRRLLTKHGYRIAEEHHTIMPLERIIPLKATSPVLRFGSHLLRMLIALAPGLFAYEIVVAAEHDASRQGNS